MNSFTVSADLEQNLGFNPECFLAEAKARMRSEERRVGKSCVGVWWLGGWGVSFT